LKLKNRVTDPTGQCLPLVSGGKICGGKSTNQSGDYQQAGKLKRFQLKRHELHFADATQQFVLTELARGDLDRDGNEDALVAVAWAYRGGSGNGFHTVVIRRADPKARLAVDPMPLP